MKISKNKIIKTAIVYLVSLFVIAFLFVVSIGAGYKDIDFFGVLNGIFSGNDSVVDVLMRVNMPRTLVAFFSGIALSIAGVLFQSTTKNKLSDPSIIGISSSTYTFSLIISLTIPALMPFAPIFSTVFGFGIFMLIFWLSYGHGVKSNRMLAVGAAINAVFMMIMITIAVMQNFAAFGVLLSMVGSLSVPKPEIVYATIALSSIGSVLAFLLAHRCNVLALGDKTAQSLGINVLLSKCLIATVGVFLTATAVVNVGITAFLGLLAPLIAKKILSDNHFNLIPLSGILGGIILLSADCFGRALNTPVTLPVGIITTIAGGIMFILLLKRAKN